MSDALTIPSEVLQRPLEGRNLVAQSLAGLSEKPCLLVFLRHFG